MISTIPLLETEGAEKSGDQCDFAASTILKSVDSKADPRCFLIVQKMTASHARGPSLSDYTVKAHSLTGSPGIRMWSQR
jgi:hypothetical protein